jgi:hypothetical protein
MQVMTAFIWLRAEHLCMRKLISAFHGRLSDCQFLKVDSVTRSWLLSQEHNRVIQDILKKNG